MSPLINFAIKNLKKSKIRSGLSILAVFLGVLLITTLLVMTDSLVAAVDDSLDIVSGVVVVQQEDALDPNTSILNTEIIDNLIEANRSGGPIAGTIDSVVEEIWRLEKSETGVFGFVQIIGLTPSKERATVGVLDAANFEEGRTLQDTDYNATVIGSTAAFTMNKQVGDFIEVNRKQVEVVGIFNTDSFLDNTIFMPIDLVETFSAQFANQEYVSTALIKPVDLEAGAVIKDYVNDVLAENEDVEASDFDEIAEQGRRFLEITTDYAFYLGLISIIIGSLSVFNAILMSVMERKREIAILKATGWSDKEVGYEVFIESVIIAAIGGVGGLIFGIIISYYVTYTSEFLDLVILPLTLVQSYVYAVFLGIFAGLYPAIRAMRIDPVKDLAG